jgi:transcription-repair coupling factor (superfamily II helicase)
MRDLDIRGAGNLLGGEQSGFINDLGYDMYHKILDEAVQELKENEWIGVRSKQLTRLTVQKNKMSFHRMIALEHMTFRNK